MKIERTELARFVPLAVAHALVMATLYVLKPLRNALFLDRVGVAELPYATIAVALAGAVAGSVYGRLANRVRLDRLITATFAASIVVLAGLGFLVTSGGKAAVYALYVAISLTGLVTVSLVWLLANETFDARQARRLFGSIGAAGIAGAIGGGLFTKWAVHALGTEGLVIVAIGALTTSAVLVRLGGKANTKRAPKRANASVNPLAELSSSDLLRGITIVTAIGGVVSVIADIQYNDFVARSFATREEKAAFLGVFGAVLSAFAFLVQLLVTPRVLASRGVGAALLVLPLALAGGSLALVIAPTLAAASVLKVADGGLRHSIHKSASEILVTPLPADVRARSKIFLDATIGTASEAGGALVVLLLTRVFGVAYPMLGIVSLLLIAVWLTLGAQAKRAYVGAFRRALERRELDLSDVRTNVVDASAIATLTAGLRGPNERSVIYALDMLASVVDPSLVPVVLPLLEHASPDVRMRAVRVLRQQEDEEIKKHIEPLLRDEAADVRVEAVLLLGRDGRHRALLEDDDLRVRVAALAFVAEEGTAADREVIDEKLVRRTLEEAEGEDGCALRAQIARALGGLPSLGHVLRDLTLDRSPEVVVRAIASVGKTRDDGVIPWLVERLGQARYRKQAREALASFGLRAIEPIGALFEKKDTPRAIRLQLPRVLAEIPLQESIALLETQLSSKDGALVLASAKAITELTRKSPALAIYAARVAPVLSASIAELQELARLEPGDGVLERTPAGKLLARALRERRAALLERAFRLLALLYPAKEMTDAYHGVLSRDQRLRAHAIEFLDNVVDRRFAVPLSSVLEQTKKSKAPALELLLEHLVSGSDPWLRACAIACATRTLSTVKLEAALARCKSDPEPVVREALTLRSEQGA